MVHAMNFIPEFGSWNLKSYAEAEELAVTVATLHPELIFLPYDYGRGRISQYGIITAPDIGDTVYQSYNGHTFPAGKVELIDVGYNRIRANGRWYYREKKQPAWANAGWYLIKGE
jgi:hypothetical protein